MLNQTYDDGKSVVELMYRTERVSKACHMRIIYNKLILFKSALRFICTCTSYLLSPIDAQMIFICSTFSYNEMLHDTVVFQFTIVNRIIKVSRDYLT